MINLSVGQTNNFIIYADTISSDVQIYGDYFLFGFRSLYTRHWTYTIGQVLKRNSRFIQFNISVVEPDSPDDPLNGVIEIYPPGNYSYKLWNLTEKSLDPACGILIDEGQMIMDEYTKPEIIQYTYTSNNEYLQNIIYYSGYRNDCLIDFRNSIYYVREDMLTLCQPLIISDDGGFAIIEDGNTWTLN